MFRVYGNDSPIVYPQCPLVRRRIPPKSFGNRTNWNTTRSSHITWESRPSDLTERKLGSLIGRRWRGWECVWSWVFVCLSSGWTCVQTWHKSDEWALGTGLVFNILKTSQRLQTIFVQLEYKRLTSKTIAVFRGMLVAILLLLLLLLLFAIFSALGASLFLWFHLDDALDTWPWLDHEVRSTTWHFIFWQDFCSNLWLFWHH